MTYAGPRYDKEAWRASVLNGRVGPGKLHPVEAWPTFDRDLNGPCMAHPEAAAAMGVMLRTAWASDVKITPSLSYRTLAVQQQKWIDFQHGGNLAATPGTSNHGWGVAFDMSWDNDGGLAWIRANAGRYGLVNDVPTEPWHWVLYEGRWQGRQDMTEEELASLKASEQFHDGDRLYRNKYAEKGSDPGPPPENFPPAKREGWGSARFAVRLDAVHMNQEHGD